MIDVATVAIIRTNIMIKLLMVLLTNIFQFSSMGHFMVNCPTIKTNIKWPTPKQVYVQGPKVHWAVPNFKEILTNEGSTRKDKDSSDKVYSMQTIEIN